ncbi:unnamed protein product, partial [Rotaria sp. Silwood1]
KRIRGRCDEAIRLCNLLDESIKRLSENLKEKDRHHVLTSEELGKAQKSIAYGCIKYTDLSHHQNSDYVFSFDRYSMPSRSSNGKQQYSLKHQMNKI